MANYISVSFAGGFGNQLFQYAFARSYAEKYDAILETPQWIGQSIFELSDPTIHHKLPSVDFDEIPNGIVNINLHGYFQSQSAINFMSRSKLKSWFKFRNNTNIIKPQIAAHVRRGDYVNLNNIYCVINKQSYLSACEKHNLSGDITWVQDSPCKNKDIPFLDDFLLLMNADVLLRANSTFSWWAGTLGRCRVFSPIVENRIGYQNVEFVEGNWPRMVDTSNCGTHVTDLHLGE